MDAPQRQRSRIPANSTHDFITNLPPNVKDKILLKLPIKEVVRTSILSTKWIDAWVSIPDLVFQEYCTASVLIKMVDMVLLRHQGPIQKFKLRGDHDGCNEAIGRWLLVLSRNGIKDLELQFYENAILEVPSRLTSCIVLEHLRLWHCSINIPAFFQGFKQLRTLILSHCKLSGISLEKLISSCPLLDHFKLLFFYQDCLRICASNLTSLDIVGGFPDICLETPKLASAFIRLTTRGNNDNFSVAIDRKESNIIRALGRLSNIHKLTIAGAFLQYLAIGAIPENLPVVFNHLTDISLNLYIKPNEISAALCLLQNSPNLEELCIKFISVNQPNVEAAWESKASHDRLFKHLKVVKIEYSFGGDFYLLNTKSVLEFATLVLSTAPVLEKLIFTELKAAMVIFEMLKWFPKLSKNAEIAFA